MKKLFALFIFFLVFSMAEKTTTHPHVFIYSSIDAVFDENGLEGFRIYWKFDEMFSNMFIFDFDKNNNLSFEKEELKALENGAFKNLKKFDYFSHVKIEDKIFKVSYVKDFKAWIKNGNLYYSFFIPCHVKGYQKEKVIKISVYDHTYYCSVFLTRKPLYLENAENFQVSYDISRNSDEAYYFNQIFPEEITIGFRFKNE